MTNPNARAASRIIYGLILCGVLEDIKYGACMGQLAMKLTEKFKLEKVRTRVTNVFYAGISHWYNPVHNSLPPLRRIIQAAQSQPEENRQEFAKRFVS